jgi:hypothetical protein
MVKQRFHRRFILPLFIVVGVWAVSALIYDSAYTMDPGFLRNAAINIFGPLLFLSIWFFAFVGPPLAYFQGANFVERLIIALANPVLWVIRVEARLACQFTGIEMIYFFFLPWTFSAICVALFEFSVADIFCRWIHKRRKPNTVRILHPGVLLLMIVSLGGIYIGLAKGQEWVYLVVHHYASHFLH